jgi:hypothetical protein
LTYTVAEYSTLFIAAGAHLRLRAAPLNSNAVLD